MVTAFALWAGGRLVRVVALVHAANWLLVGVLQVKHDHAVFPLADFIVDVLGALTIAGLAVWSRRTWLAIMAAFLILGVANYAVHLSEMRSWHRAFITTGYLWGFGALVSLAAGAMHARRATRLRAL